jgi:4-amino-4-deoxy-L-arabinose transferase-like glycosyltransferase
MVLVLFFPLSPLQAVVAAGQVMVLIQPQQEEQAVLVAVAGMLMPLVAQEIHQQHLHHKVAMVALVVLVLVVAAVAVAEQVLSELLVRLKQVAMVAMEQHHLFLVQASHTQVVVAAVLTLQEAQAAQAVAERVEHQQAQLPQLLAQQILVVAVVADIRI